MTTAKELADRARRYWQTYLPSQVETMSETDREKFFRSLAEQTLQAARAMADDVILAGLPEGASDADRARWIRGAMMSAESDAIRDMVLLPPEPGTEDRRMPGTPLLDGEDEETPAG